MLSEYAKVLAQIDIFLAQCGGAIGDGDLAAVEDHDVIGDLEGMELAHPSEVCYGRVIRTKYGYVVQDDNYRRNLKKAKEYFEGAGIPLCGRVAEFEYINMDVCIERARNVAGRLNREVMVPACQMTIR